VVDRTNWTFPKEKTINTDIYKSEYLRSISGPHRYYGFYSKLSCGKRKKSEQGKLIPSILKPDGSSKEHRKNWSRFIQKICEVDPLTCPKCQGRMRILVFIK
jgi:hypothetical protein